MQQDNAPATGRLLSIPSKTLRKLDSLKLLVCSVSFEKKHCLIYRWPGQNFGCLDCSWVTLLLPYRLTYMSGQHYNQSHRCMHAMLLGRQRNKHIIPASAGLATTHGPPGHFVFCGWSRQSFVVIIVLAALVWTVCLGSRLAEHACKVMLNASARCFVNGSQVITF